ncbi:MAG: hypothetical protein Q9218_006679 [Villophora microphyllina]
MQTSTMPASPTEPTSVLTPFWYPSVPVEPTNSPSSSPSNSPPLPVTAFWAVLSAVILLLVLLAVAFPLWYCLRKRHRKSSSASFSGNDQPPPFPRSWLLSTLTSPQHGQQQQLPPLTPQQQFQLLHSLAQPPPAHARHPSDLTTSAVLARIAALGNPSILGAIPEDSTQFTASSLHPRPPPVNQYYQKMMDRKMEEMRLKKEIEIEGSGDAAAAGEGGKKVRFREQEWAVLGTDFSSSVGGFGNGGVEGKAHGMKKI